MGGELAPARAPLLSSGWAGAGRARALCSPSGFSLPGGGAMGDQTWVFLCEIAQLDKDQLRMF